MKWVHGLFMAVVLSAVGGVASDATPHRARLAVTIDFVDVVASTPHPLTKKDMDHVMADIADGGFDRVYFRVDATGLLQYPTKVGTPFRDMSRGELSKNMMATRKNLGDVLMVAAEAAKRHHLEFYAWMPPRDQDANELGYNFYDPDEREQFIRSGANPSWADFFHANERFQLERREGFLRVTGENVPRVKWLELRTKHKDQTVRPEDVQLLSSWDNLIYEPVADTWKVQASRDGEYYVYRIGPLDVHAPWLKVAQRHYGKWNFVAGLGKPGFTLYDPQDRAIQSGSWWIRYQDRHPETGRALAPFSGTSRPGWSFSFDERGNSCTIYTPAFPARRYLMGAPCFAYPEVRDYFVKIIEELSQYPIGGVALIARTHVRSAQGDDYGFNPPIVEEYKKRYGVDIRTQDFDRAKWLAIRGDYYTQMLQRMSQVLHKKGQKLIAMFEPPLDSGAYQGRGDNLVGQDQGPFDWQWKKWVNEGIVDSAMMASIGFNMEWTPKLAAYASGVRKQMTKGGLTIFYNPDLDTPPATFKAFLKASLADPNVEEVVIYEYVEVAKDIGPGLHEALVELKGK